MDFGRHLVYRSRSEMPGCTMRAPRASYPGQGRGTDDGAHERTGSKVVLIAGGGTGIGRTTELFTAGGARVIVFAPRREPLGGRDRVDDTAIGMRVPEFRRHMHPDRPRRPRERRRGGLFLASKSTRYITTPDARGRRRLDRVLSDTPPAS